MPTLNQPNFPVTEKPQLSPNPNLSHSLKDGGRETPEIVMTEPKVQAPYDPRAAVEALQAEVSALDTEIDALKPYAISGDEDDVTKDDVIAIVEGDYGIIDFNGGGYGLVTHKLKTSSTLTGTRYTLCVLIDPIGNGLDYTTIKYSVAHNALSTPSKIKAQANIAYTTEAPEADNENGHLIFVVLDEDPAQFFDGYYYVICSPEE